MMNEIQYTTPLLNCKNALAELSGDIAELPPALAGG
jgi:hypothetical protein